MFAVLCDFMLRVTVSDIEYFCSGSQSCYLPNSVVLLLYQRGNC